MKRRDLLKGIGAAALLQPSAAMAADAPADDDTIYELRVYHLNENTEAAILDRFRTAETKIFERLGMHGVGYWLPADAPAAGQTLVYMLRHRSRAVAARSWATFKVDPEWMALKAVSEKNGPFVAKSESTFLRLTDFSPRV